MTASAGSARRVPLARSLARYRLRALVLVALSASLLALLVVGIATIRGSLSSALETGVRADAGGRPFVVQAGSDEARAAVADAPELLPVLDAEGSVESGSALVPGVVRVVGTPGLSLATLVRGRAPEKAGEATVSREVAASVGIGLGDEASVASGGEPVTVRVVGVTVDAADVEDATVVLLDPELRSEDATVWLASTDPYADPALQELMDARSITYRSTDSVVEAARASMPVRGSTLTSLQWGVGSLMLVVCLSLLAVLAPLARRDASTLVAAGMAPARVWRVIAGLVLGALVVGVAVGSTLATLATWAAREPTSRLFGQDWQRVEVAVVPMVALMVLSVLLTGAIPALVRAARALRGRAPRPWPRLRLSRLAATVAVAVGGLTVAVGLLASRAESPPEVAALLPPFGAIVAAAGLPTVVGVLMNRGLPPAMRAVARRLTTALGTAVVVAAVVATWTGFYGASTTHDANAFEAISGAPQPPGSFLLTEVPDGAADALVARYRELGGSEIVQYDLPNERSERLRATGSALVQCMQRAGTLNPDQVDAGCFPQETLSPVAVVVLSRSEDDRARADPGLVRDGEVGLLLYRAFTPEAASLGTTDAEPDKRLGGNMPGLVVPADGDVAERFGLRRSGTRLVALLDFDQLTGQAQARLRSLVSQVAPAAQIAESGDAGTYGAERARALGVALVGAAMVALILLGGGLGVVLSHRRTRRTLADLGASAAQRRSLTRRWVGVPVAVMGVCAALAWVSATAVGTQTSGSMGVAWLAPFGSGVLSCAVLFLMMTRVPERSGE